MLSNGTMTDRLGLCVAFLFVEDCEENRKETTRSAQFCLSVDWFRSPIHFESNILQKNILSNFEIKTTTKRHRRRLPPTGSYEYLISSLLCFAIDAEPLFFISEPSFLDSSLCLFPCPVGRRVLPVGKKELDDRKRLGRFRNPSFINIATTTTDERLSLRAPLFSLLSFAASSCKSEQVGPGAGKDSFRLRYGSQVDRKVDRPRGFYAEKKKNENFALIRRHRA